MSESKPKKRTGKRKSDPAEQVANGAGRAESLNEFIRKLAEDCDTPDARAKRKKRIEEWRRRIEARYSGCVNEWERLYQRDRVFPKPSEVPEVPPANVNIMCGGFSIEVEVDPVGHLSIESVIDSLEEVRLGWHFDAESNQHPGVSNSAISTLQTALRYCPEIISRALDRSPRNLAILATRRVAHLLGSGFGKFDPNWEITDSCNLASKGEILLVMELVCPNVWARFLRGKSTRTLAKWWIECDLKCHPEDRGGPLNWEEPYREYYGIPRSIPPISG